MEWKQALWLRHNRSRSEEMSDVNFLRSFFFFGKYLTWIIQIRTCLVRGWLLLLLTLVQGEHRKCPSAQPPWTQDEETDPFFFFFFEAKEDSQGSRIVKNFRWLAGWPAGTTPVLECLWLVNKAQSPKEHRFLPSPILSGAGTEAENQKALITCLQLTTFLTLNYVQFVWLSQS